MTTVTRTQLEGMAGLKAALAEIGTETATKVGNKADRDAAKAIAEVFKLAVPVSDHATAKGKGGAYSYGHWRDNIRVKKSKARTETTISYRVDMGDAFWSRFYEFGTSKQPARPIIRAAFEASAPRALTVQIGGLRMGIDKAAKKAARAAKVLPNGRNA